MHSCEVEAGTLLLTCGVPSFHELLLGVAFFILGSKGWAGASIPPHQSASCKLGLSPNSSNGCLTGLSSLARIGVSLMKRASGRGILQARYTLKCHQRLFQLFFLSASISIHKARCLLGQCTEKLLTAACSMSFPSCRGTEVARCHAAQVVQVIPQRNQT